jgi:integrase
LAPGVDDDGVLERRHVNTAKGTLTVERSKTDAGVRVVDLTPAVRDELATYLAGKDGKPTDLVFPTATGRKDNRQNIRRRLFMPAIVRANVRLAELGIEQLGDVRPHGLRRTYASRRTACGDDPVYVSKQIGHEDVSFTLNVYANSVKRRERMTEAGRSGASTTGLWNGRHGQPQWALSEEVAEHEKSPA